VHWATDVTAAFSLGAALALVLIGAHLLLRLRHLDAPRRVTEAFAVRASSPARTELTVRQHHEHSGKQQ
jgi:membrane-associated phospholipid phosphatase